MAITFLLAKATPNALYYIVDQDGNAGDVATLSAAVLQADAVAGPLKELLDNPTLASKGNALGALTVADARRAMLGDASTDADKNLTNIPHCKTTITAFVAGADALPWAVDAGVPISQDAYQVIVQGLAVLTIGTALLQIEFQHTITR